MADKNNSSSSNTDQASISYSEPTKTPQTAPSQKLNREEHQEPETTPESKRRRKTCPTALDKIQEISQLSNGYFSFTFDTKLAGCPPDHITPKFGSFNHHHQHAVSNQVKKMKKKNHQLLNDFEDKEGDEQREEEDKG